MNWFLWRRRPSKPFSITPFRGGSRLTNPRKRPRGGRALVIESLETRNLLSATAQFDPTLNASDLGHGGMLAASVANFYNSATASYIAPSGSVDAQFSGTPGNVQVAGAVAVNSISVESDGYNFTAYAAGAALNLPTNARISITTGDTAAFAVSIATGGLEFTGGGTAMLSGTNSYASGTQVDGSTTVIVTAPQGIPSGSDVTVGDEAPFASGPPTPSPPGMARLRPFDARATDQPQDKSPAGVEYANGQALQSVSDLGGFGATRYYGSEMLGNGTALGPGWDLARRPICLAPAVL